MAAFISVYKCLLLEKLSSQPNDGLNLLHLLRLVRNTVHNNGVYFHPSGADETVEWNGQQFEFRQESLVRFVGWRLTIEIADALQKLIASIARDPALTAISDEITDPANIG